MGNYPTKEGDKPGSRKNPPPTYCQATSVPEGKSDKTSETLDRAALEEKIKQLFRKVWLGLYQVDDPCEYRTQANRLRVLYQAAGLPYLGYGIPLLGVIQFHLARTSNRGVASLILYDCTSLSKLQLAVSLLEKHEREIENFEKLLTFLRKNQSGINETRITSKTRRRQKKLDQIAVPMVGRLRRYLIKVNLLNQDICDEAAKLHAQGRRPKGYYVFEKVDLPSKHVITGTLSREN